MRSPLIYISGLVSIWLIFGAFTNVVVAQQGYQVFDDRIEIAVSKTLRTSASFGVVADVLERRAVQFGLRRMDVDSTRFSLEGDTGLFFVSMTNRGSVPEFVSAEIEGREIISNGSGFQNVLNVLLRESADELQDEHGFWVVRVPDLVDGPTECWATLENSPDQLRRDVSDVLAEAEVFPMLHGGMDALVRAIVYPEPARRAGVEGRVFVSFIVNRLGVPECLMVINGLPTGLSEAAIEAVKQMTFEPGTVDGKAVAVLMAVPITFRLN